MLPTPPREVYASGGMHAEALVIGHTSFDGTAAFYATAPLANATPAEWDARMRARFRPHASAVQAQYPLTRYTGKGYPAVPASYIAADSDERVACPTAALARLAARSALCRCAGATPSASAPDQARDRLTWNTSPARSHS